MAPFNRLNSLGFMCQVAGFPLGTFAENASQVRTVCDLEHLARGVGDTLTT